MARQEEELKALAKHRAELQQQIDDTEGVWNKLRMKHICTLERIPDATSAYAYRCTVCLEKSRVVSAIDQHAPVKITEGALCCLLCGGEYTHLNHVVVMAQTRPFGAPVDVVHVTHVAGVDAERMGAIEPALEYNVTLMIDCESCGHRGAVAFDQYKGATYVSIADRGEAHD